MTKYIDHPVYDRLYFAEKRLNDLGLLNGGDIAGAQDRDRQPLIEEFFFHLGGAIDFLLQEINKTCHLNLDEESVNAPNAIAELSKSTQYRQLKSLVEVLHPATRGKQLPGPDFYTTEASHFRVVLFRNFVTHRHHNAFLFKVRESGARTTHLLLDPRTKLARPESASTLEASDEMDKFLKLVTEKCTAALKQIGVV